MFLWCVRCSQFLELYSFNGIWMNDEYWALVKSYCWGNTKVHKRKLFHCHFIYHKSHIGWPGIECVPVWWESGNYDHLCSDMDEYARWKRTAICALPLCCVQSWHFSFCVLHLFLLHFLLKKGCINSPDILDSLTLESLASVPKFPVDFQWAYLLL